MDRDYETKGRILLKTKFGVVNADNFNEDAQQSAELKKEVGLEGGPYCLPPWELDIPF